MKTIRTILILIAAGSLCAAVGQTQDVKQEAKIVMTHVKYDGLKQEILKHRGKVVVVDFWATWCPACQKAFPDFVEMQKQHADKGLVVISVSLDDASESDYVETANKFLTRQKSHMRNLLLDESSKFWGEKLGANSLPIYYLFDRQGKWVAYRAANYGQEGIPYDKLKETVAQMLSEK
ncbi:MAG: redoxin family protein [Planctomycetes bacterium]|nr:redoxin family protein [Planctomycetota bacterium]